MVSSREPMPTGVFTSNQHKPSIRYEEWGQTKDELSALGLRADQLPAPSDHEVMEVGKDSAAEPDLLADWWTPYLDWLLHGVLPIDKMEARQIACQAKSFFIIEGELYK
ncbi:uncharacterized protein [Miscanthus floridulus]|uniref:uncharacterized protein n=1 Tax=Miscanthus floridulus TaxID=154761 RepID=UPI003458D65B